MADSLLQFNNFVEKGVFLKIICHSRTGFVNVLPNELLRCSLFTKLRMLLCGREIGLFANQKRPKQDDLCKNISDVQTDLDLLSDAPVSRIQLIVTELIIQCVVIGYVGRRGRRL